MKQNFTIVAILIWICLIIAGLLEPCWVIALEKSNKLRNLKWTLVTIVTMFGSLYLLSLAMKELPVGMSYAIWTGIGAIGTLIGGMILYKEPVTWLRILFILLIVVGIVGIQLSGGL